MASGFLYFLSSDPHEVEALRGKAIWAIVLGIALAAVGVVAIGHPVVTTAVTMVFFGVLLLIGSGVQMVSAVWARSWGGFFLQVLIGLLYFFVGVVMVERPLFTADELTLLLAIFFVAAGLYRLVMALRLRFSGWGWSALNGAVTLLLGVLIWRHWPGDGMWVVGTFVGIEMLFNGLSWVMLGLALRSAPPRAVV
jgi:uncharacterized membrane protein HdeD (DUF308 family)